LEAKNRDVEGIDTSTSVNEIQQKVLSGKTKVIAIGFILAVIGSIIAGSYAKDTIINYSGFVMFLAGIATCILGIFSTIAATLKLQFSRETPALVSVNKPQILYLSIWSIGVGVTIAIIGSILASAFAKYTSINATGFGMMLGGISISVLGFFVMMFSTIRTHNHDRKIVGHRVYGPRFLFPSIISIGFGTVLTIIGSIISRSYAKETMINYTGFGTLLLGIAILSIGISGALVAILKNRWGLDGKRCPNEPRVLLVSIWAIGVGSMLIVVGSLLAGSFEKNTILNFAGFGMLLAGTGAFVYGVFDTARISAIDFLNRKRNCVNTEVTGENSKIWQLPRRESLEKRFAITWRNLVASRAVLNIVGIMVAVGLLFFGLWQLDLIVSGPVWWSSSPNGQGSGWTHQNGAYANDYFQCFFWKTTVGQAYDTLFLLIFISFIVIFLSAFFWPRTRIRNSENLQ